MDRAESKQFGQEVAAVYETMRSIETAIQSGEFQCLSTKGKIERACYDLLLAVKHEVGTLVERYSTKIQTTSQPANDRQRRILIEQVNMVEKLDDGQN